MFTCFLTLKQVGGAEKSGEIPTFNL